MGRSAVVLLCLVACVDAPSRAGVDPSPGCAGDDECPSGFVCLQGACHLDEDEEGDEGDSDSSDAAPKGTKPQSEPSPFASFQCAPCQTNDDCGGDPMQAGCWLANPQGVTAFCALDCTSKDVCPPGSRCVQDANDNLKTCVSVGSGCPAPATTPPPEVCTNDTWANYAQHFYSANCASCHAWARTLSKVKSRAVASEEEIKSGDMPKRATLSAAEIARVTKWIDCGLPK